jgi:large subunit ribosomal protein L29
MKVSELREKSEQELQTLLADLKKSIFVSKNQMVQNKKFEELAKNRSRKKQIARILTILREKANARS